MNILKLLKTTLKGNLSTTGTTFTVQKFVDSKDVEVVDADFNGDFVVVITQGTKIEMILCSGITQNGSDNTAILTVASNGRHLNPKSPWTGGATGLQFTTGASVIVTNDPYTMSRLASIDKTNTFSLKQTFTIIPESSDVPVANNDLVNKTYADALVIGALTTINLIVPATAGETVSAGDLVYYDTTDKEWKLCDADTANTVENVMLAIAQGAGTNGNAIAGGILLRGVDSNQSGMTAGDIMYAGNTAGAISSSVGTKEVAVGVAKSATNLYFNPRFNQMLTEDEQDALAGNLGTPSTNDKYITQTGLQKGAEVFGADAEANDTYVITLSPVPASLYTGMVIRFSVNTANTGACTLNVNSLGAIAIKKRNDQDLETGDIESGQIITVVYDGTNFQMQSQMATNDANVPTGKTTKSGSLTISEAVSSDSDTVALGFRPRLVIFNIRIASSGASVESVAIGQIQYVDGVGYTGIKFGGISADCTEIDDLEYQYSSIIGNNGMKIDTAGLNLIDGYISITNVTSTGFDIVFTRTDTAGTASATATYQLTAIE